MFRAIRWLMLPVIVAAGCARPSEPAARANVGVSVGQQAPDFAGVDLDGKPLRLSDFLGKVVLIDFWQDNCPPCRMFHATEEALTRQFPADQLAIVGVNLDGDARVARRVQEREHLPWRSVHDASGFISLQWGVSGTPTVYVLDRQGVVRFMSPGLPPRAEVESVIRKLIDAEAPAS